MNGFTWKEPSTELSCKQNFQVAFLQNLSGFAELEVEST